TSTVANERLVTVSGIGSASGVAIERKRPHRRIVTAGRIIEKRGCSVRRVIGTGGVEQECGSTSGRIVVSGIEHERIGANARTKTAGRNALERERPNCSIANTGSEVKKGVLPFGRGEVGIASVWSWNYPKDFRSAAQTEDGSGNEYADTFYYVFFTGLFHFLSLPVVFDLLVLWVFFGCA